MALLPAKVEAPVGLDEPRGCRARGPAVEHLTRDRRDLSRGCDRVA